MKGLFTLLIGLGLSALLSCGRTIMQKPLQIPYTPGPDTAAISSSVAYINGFVISAVDNPGVLKRDVTGDITFNKVRLVFDSGTNISNLIPTISYVGKSLSPASQTPEDFDSTLQYTLIASDGSVLPYRIEVAFQ